MEPPRVIPGCTPQIFFSRHPQGIFSEKATPGIPRKIPGVPGTPLPKISFAIECFICKLIFTLRTPEYSLIFSAGLPTAACLPGGNTWRIRGEYGDAPGYTRDIHGIPGRGAKPLQIYVPKYALWSPHPEAPHLPESVPGIPSVIPGAAPCPPPCAAGEDTPCVPRGTANASVEFPPLRTPWVATCGHGLEPAQFDTSSEMLEQPPARHRVHRGTTREGRGATPTPRVPAAACRDASGGPRAGLPPTPCPPGDYPGGARSPPT